MSGWEQNLCWFGKLEIETSELIVLILLQTIILKKKKLLGKYIVIVIFGVARCARDLSIG